jgi:hypothetical protein
MLLVISAAWQGFPGQRLLVGEKIRTLKEPETVRPFLAHSSAGGAGWKAKSYDRAWELEK